LNITGDAFSATCGFGGAAIGSGTSLTGRSTIGNLNIMERSFNVFGGDYAPGIGSGYADDSSEWVGDKGKAGTGESTVDVLNLVNGTFVVIGGIFAAGIGSGFAVGGGRSIVGCLAFFGGSYNATGGEACGAGIGSGCASGSGPAPTFNESQSTVSSLVIADGDFSIQGRSNSAGIGSGTRSKEFDQGSDGRSNIDLLEIQNGSFRIAAGTGGSGIGATGRGSAVTDLIISDGVFEIGGSNMEACIGTASGATISSIGIQSGSYNLSSPLGIGAAGNSFVGAISIGANSRTVFLDCSSLSSEICVNATSLYLGKSSINAIVAGGRFLSFESLSAEESKLWIQYVKTSVREGITGIPSLHFGKLVIPVDEPGIGKMIYSPLELFNESLTREGDFHSSAMTGLLVSLWAPGKYSVSYHPLGTTQEIPLCFIGTHSTFEVSDGQEQFLSSVGKCLPTPSPLFTISTEYTP
jgi:hypothetical protein